MGELLQKLWCMHRKQNYVVFNSYNYEDYQSEKMLQVKKKGTEQNYIPTVIIICKNCITW